ncbi:hypothetical protein, partial [Xanthomonas vesicatoria]|uniref:hypothetical protein n=3 Tax=Xanthomonas vesicatoria TaxID=56460 RepID=UPI0019D03EB7
GRIGQRSLLSEFARAVLRPSIGRQPVFEQFVYSGKCLNAARRATDAAAAGYRHVRDRNHRSA